MPKELTPDEMLRLESWVAEIRAALTITIQVPTVELLDLAADVAHQLLRPASPVTGFLIGAALAADPTASPQAVIAQVRAVLEEQQPRHQVHDRVHDDRV